MTLFRNRYRVESIRLADWDYSSRGWYFVTICTKDKRCLLGDAVDGEVALSDAGVIAEQEMKALTGHYSNVAIDRFVVMPNHVHAIVVIDGEHVYSPSPTKNRKHSAMLAIPLHERPDNRQELARAGDAASRVSTGGIRLPSLAEVVGGYKAGVSRICHAKGLPGFAWQARFHEHILRSNASVNAVRDYIDHNPRNWLDDPDNPRRPPQPETRQAASLRDRLGRVVI